MSHNDYVSNWYEFAIQLNSDPTTLLSVLQKKADTIDQIIKNKKPDAKTIVAFGLTPEILPLTKKYVVTIIEPATPANEFVELLNYHQCPTLKLEKYIPLLTFDVVLGLNQYITYKTSELTQQEHITDVFKLLKSGGLYVNSIRDYKNIKTNKLVDEIFTLRNHYIIETRVWNKEDKSLYEKTLMVITNREDTAELLILGPVDRKTMMFKNLARLCNANNGHQFEIDQHRIYKPLYSKSFQYIITVIKE